MSQSDHVHVLVLVTSLAGPSHYCVLINTSVVVCVLLRVFLFSVFFFKSFSKFDLSGLSSFDLSDHRTLWIYRSIYELCLREDGSVSGSYSQTVISGSVPDFYDGIMAVFFFNPLLSEGLSSATEISPDALNLFEVMYQR